MHNVGDRQICVIDTTKDDVIPFENDNTEESLHISPTEIQFLFERAKDAYCKSAALEIGCHGSGFSFNNSGLLTQVSNDDKSTQIVVAESFTKANTVLVTSSTNFRTPRSMQDVRDSPTSLLVATYG